MKVIDCWRGRAGEHCALVELRGGFLFRHRYQKVFVQPDKLRDAWFDEDGELAPYSFQLSCAFEHREARGLLLSNDVTRNVVLGRYALRRGKD